MARGNTDKYTIEQIITAIKGSSGIKMTIMRRLDCSRNTVDNYLRRYATAQAAYDEETELPLDFAESIVINDMANNRSVETAKWYLKAKGRSRGYTDRSETEHSGTIEHKHVTELSDEELSRIAALSGSGTAKA